MEPSLRPWGEGEEMLLAAGVKDPSGNLWFFAAQ
jgi:hypothetical protein